MRLASFNVNSLRARLANVLEWLSDSGPDVALLQEIKCETDSFPRLEIEALGYHAAVLGQKAYNGVAILSKRPIEAVREDLPGDTDDLQARYLEATIDGVRVASLYAPNGNPPGDVVKFQRKLAWLSRLRAHAARLLDTGQPLVLGGDYNVIPEEVDCHDPQAWRADALFQPESRRCFRALTHLGLYDAYRALHRGGGAFTFWDYQGRAFEADHGIRIDHFLLSPQAADRLQACSIDRKPRGRPKASDHTPIEVSLREA